MSESDNVKQKDLAFWLLAVVLVIVVAGVGLGWWYYVRPMAYDAYGQWHVGVAGDSFAPIAGVLSFVAIVLALLAVYYQRIDLRETRKEIEQSRKAQQKQAKHLARANELQNDANKLAKQDLEDRKLARAVGVATKLANWESGGDYQKLMLNADKVANLTGHVGDSLHRQLEAARVYLVYLEEVARALDSAHIDEKDAKALFAEQFSRFRLSLETAAQYHERRAKIPLFRRGYDFAMRSRE